MAHLCQGWTCIFTIDLYTIYELLITPWSMANTLGTNALAISSDHCSTHAYKTCVCMHCSHNRIASGGRRLIYEGERDR